MTGAEWLKARSFLKLWQGRRWPRAAERKMRLFGCACCRRLGELLSDPRSHQALDTAEKFADGEVGKAALKAAGRLAHAAVNAFGRLGFQADTARCWAASAVEMTTHLTLPDAFGTSAVRASIALALAKVRTKAREDALQADVLRDIFGNPYRHRTVDPAWLAWQGGTVARLARAVYDERAFDRLPILADALEEAGCTDRDMLSHCRRGEHVRGCWVVDLLLAKG